MINGIKKKIYNFLYSLPFGLKGANDEMFSQKESANSDLIGVHQVINENRLSKDLLKGEVTQQVEELRYRDYKVSRESKKYKYLGEGIAIKNDEYCTFNLNDFNIIQENKLICKSTYDEMNRVDTEQYSNDEYTLKIIYNDVNRFKLEKYCYRFDFYTENGSLKFVMRFHNMPNKNDITSYSFLNEMKYIFDNFTKTNDYIKLDMIEFVTYKCIGDEELVKYNLYDLKLYSIKYSDDNKEMLIEYSVDYFVREDLIEKYHSNTMEEKYKNKEKKEITLDLNNNERERYCGECGKKISVYDGDITETTYGIPLCKECLEKTLLLKENVYNLNKEE